MADDVTGAGRCRTTRLEGVWRSFGTDLSHLVHFRGKSKFSILVGFWHLSRVRGLFLCDDGLQALRQTMEQGPVAADEAV